MKEQDSGPKILTDTRRIRLDVDVAPPITHGIHPKPVYPNRITIYIPRTDEAWVRPAVKALERDASSLSAWVLARLHEYWVAHNPGNPQTPLDKYEKTPKEDLHSMSFAQLSLLYENVKTRARTSQLPTEEEMARFKLIQAELAERERVLRLR